MDILILRKEDIKKSLSMKEAIEVSKEALRFYSEGRSDIPLRTNINIKDEEAESLYMPGFVNGNNSLGVKLVSVYPHNVERQMDTISSMMILQNYKTGEVSSIIDGNYLTKLRTGAVSGAATDLLAREDSSIFALIGTGGQARTQLEAVLNVRKIREVRIFGRNKEKADKFVGEMSKEFGEIFNCKIYAAKDSDQAVKDADIVTVVTTASKPVFDGKMIKKGAHINGVGSYTPQMQELDPYILKISRKIYLDTRDGVFNESGDFIIPIKEGEFSKDKITGELGQAVMGKTPLRESQDEITLFKTVGSGVLDLVTAKKIYDRAIELKIGDNISF